MRRIVPFLLVGLGALASGCQNRNKAVSYREEPYTPAYNSLDALDQTPAAQPSAPAADATPAAADTTSDATTTAGDEPLEPVAPAGRTYVVRKGDTLFSLARRFYNDEHRWRDIWQANRDKLPDPNRLAIGMTLVIPD